MEIIIGVIALIVVVGIVITGIAVKTTYESSFIKDKISQSMSNEKRWYK